MSGCRRLPGWGSVLAVVAHPDDESVGLRAILAGFAAQGAAVSVLCFTHDEASTLHGVPGHLAVVRAGADRRPARNTASCPRRAFRRSR